MISAPTLFQMESMWQKSFRTLLEKRFEEIKRRNSSFTLRSFARKLELSPGATSEILSGHRNVSPLLAERILSKLGLPENEERKIRTQITAKANASRKLLEPQAHEIATDWRYFAILCLFELEVPVETPAEVATRLGQNENEIRALMKVLTQLGLLIMSDDEHYSFSGVHVRTSDGIPSAAILKSHEDSLKQAHTALKIFNPSERDYVSLTFAGSARNLSKAKAETRRYLNRLEKILGTGKRDSVYRVNVQLFPLDKKS